MARDFELQQPTGNLSHRGGCSRYSRLKSEHPQGMVPGVTSTGLGPKQETKGPASPPPKAQATSLYENPNLFMSDPVNQAPSPFKK